MVRSFVKIGNKFLIIEYYYGNKEDCKDRACIQALVERRGGHRLAEYYPQRMGRAIQIQNALVPGWELRQGAAQQNDGGYGGDQSKVARWIAAY